MQKSSSWAIVLVGAALAGCSSSSGGGGGAGGGGGSGGTGCSTSGTIVTLASNVPGISQIAVGGGKVVWVTSAGSTVMSVPIGGGTPTTLASNFGATSGGITADSTYAYFTDDQLGNVWKVPLAGGAPIKIVGGLNGGPRFVAVDTTNIYWTSDANNIVKFPLAGGKATKLAASTNAFNIVVNPTTVFWMDQSPGNGPPAGDIMSVPIAGGTAVTVASAQAPAGIAADSSSVYWTNAGAGGVNPPVPGGVYKAAAAGGSSPDTLYAAPAYTVPSVMAIDSANLYWMQAMANGTGATGMLMKMSLSGGTPTCIATGAILPGGLALDDTSVYWADDTDSTLVKLTPK